MIYESIRCNDNHRRTGKPFTGQFIEKVGERKFVKQVLRDTNSEREFGKAYSSIETAMKVWNSRIMKGFDYAE